MKINIIESGMIFNIDKSRVFPIEKSQVYTSLGSHVKISDLVIKKEKKLIFIEAKSSSPKPSNHIDFKKYITDIHDKLLNSLILYTGLILERHNNSEQNLSSAFTDLPLKSAELILLLIIKDHKKEWLQDIDDALNLELLSVKKCFPVDSIRVINDELALRYGLISGLSEE